ASSMARIWAAVSSSVMGAPAAFRRFAIQPALSPFGQASGARGRAFSAQILGKLLKVKAPTLGKDSSAQTASHRLAQFNQHFIKVAHPVHSAR
ncbi:MAG: hypothetical protein AAGB15_04565, partial [Pseudomonadota bacterium]